MKAIRVHKLPLLPVRLVSLAVLAVLFAHPVLAAVSTVAACNGGCLCSGAGLQATPAFHNETIMKPDCCSRAEATPCRMATDMLPACLTALLRIHKRSVFKAIHGLPADGKSADSTQPRPLFITGTGAPTDVPDPPSYLKVCRFIC